MKKVLLDTNVVLDAIAAREPFRASAERIFLCAAQGKIEAFLTASSVTDIYYIARKSIGDDAAREALRGLLQLFSLVDVRRQECEAALDLPLADYEDALMVICAKKAGADYIATRDKDFLAQSSGAMSVISPETLLRKCKS